VASTAEASAAAEVLVAAHEGTSPGGGARAVDSTRFGRERTVAIQAVRAAASLCRAVRGSLGSSGATQTATKADRSPVTVADLGSQALISLALAEAFPEDPLVGEEDSRALAAGPGSLAAAVLARVRAERPAIELGTIAEALDRGRADGGPSGRWWTVDPVDGTKGFLRGGQYAIALALLEDGAVVLGVLGCPALAADPGDPSDIPGCLFVAERGVGTWQLGLWPETDAIAHRVRVAEVADPRFARTAESVEAGHSDADVTSMIRARLGITAPPLRMDSQAKYAAVARGDASIYLRVPHGGYRENVWDHAAGWLVVSEAGGTVTDIAGRPIDFTRGRRLLGNRGILAAPPAIHAAVLEAARDVPG
jgi:3'(2'), 5'-bisphosphate nucleotidase